MAQRILRDIVERDLTPGEHMPNIEAMQKEYLVSRACLREALRILETFGVIAVKTGPGGGPYVRPINVDDYARTTALHFQRMKVSFREMIHANTTLEPMMARLAAQGQSKDALDRIGHVLELTDTAMNASNPVWLSVASAFHIAVNSASDSRVLNLYAGSLIKIRYSCTPPVRVDSRKVREQIANEHREIARAIFDGDADKAEMTVRAHRKSSVNLLTEVYPDHSAIVNWS